MAWLELLWKLEQIESNERSNDNVELHFAIVTVTETGANVHFHPTGGLLRHKTHGGLATGVITDPAARFWGRVRSQRHVPSPEYPYVGLVARAIELDSSNSSQRTQDRENYESLISSISAEAVEHGGVPGPQMLWLAGRYHDLQDDRGDDDDLIGVSARVDSNWAAAFAPDIARESEFGAGDSFGRIWTQRMRFQENGIYELIFTWVMRAQSPIPGSDFPSVQSYGVPDPILNAPVVER